jgi:uncharacterized protein YbjT (DUF2867 family)
MNNNSKLVLLTGATGYVGGRLLRALQAAGTRVRCLARRPEALIGRVGPDTEIIAGDATDLDALLRAMSGVNTAYYLVHAMGAGTGFREADRHTALTFGRAAKKAGVARIIYLGGLGAGPDLSTHLASRQEVGEILRGSGVSTVEFRASIVIGSGSLSFEMIRSLVERLPIMVTPRWVRVPAQPIAIEDVIAYLVAALDHEPSESEVFEIGGADRVTYGSLMREYARQRGLRRLMIPVPLLTPKLSSLWLGLVTPIYARVGRELVDSLRNPTVVTNDRAIRTFGVRPRGVRAAIARALVNEDHDFAETRWSDPVSSAGRQRSWGGIRFGSRIVDSRTVSVPTAPGRAFAPIRRIGGVTGWYWGNRLWRLRGFLDLLVGGVGVRRGRRDPEHPAPGDTVDFWRVEAYEPDRLLRLAAEMKLPGRAWLQFEVNERAGGAVIRQTAIFDPVGLMGLVYWYGLYPIHTLVFGGMLRAIARIALEERTT